MSEPTFFKVATRPKWIGALLLALAVAAIFASLAGWQADRTYHYVPKAPPTQVVVPIESLTQSSTPFAAKAVDRLVSVNLTRNTSFTYIVANRIQLLGSAGDHATGYWLVELDSTDQGKWLAVATGWYPSLAEARSAVAKVGGGSTQQLQKVEGIYEPSEDALPANGDVFQSLSLAQLINQPNLPANMDTYAGFIILQKQNWGGQPIVIGRNPGETVFNWLTAFYAVEWTLFAGFAVFLWARLVKDEVIRETSEGRI